MNAQEAFKQVKTDLKHVIETRGFAAKLIEAETVTQFVVELRSHDFMITISWDNENVFMDMGLVGERLYTLDKLITLLESSDKLYYFTTYEAIINTFKRYQKQLLQKSIYTDHIDELRALEKRYFHEAIRATQKKSLWSDIKALFQASSSESASESQLEAVNWAPSPCLLKVILGNKGLTVVREKNLPIQKHFIEVIPLNSPLLRMIDSDKQEHVLDLLPYLEKGQNWLHLDLQISDIYEVTAQVCFGTSQHNQNTSPLIKTFKLPEALVGQV